MSLIYPKFELKPTIIKLQIKIKTRRLFFVSFLSLFFNRKIVAHDN